MHAIRIRQSLILLLALGLHLSCAPQTEQGGEAEAPAAAVDDEAAVRAVAETWDPMMNGADLDGMMSLFAADAVRLDAGAPPSIGSEAIRRSFQRAFESASFEGSGPVEEIEVAGDWAFARGSFTEQLTDKASGEVTEEAGKWVSVFRKTQEGWTYAIDIWNRDAPSSAAVNLEAEVDTPALPEEITTGRSPDEEALLAVGAAWDTAYNASDIDGLVELYTSDAHRMSADEPDHAGQDAIRASFEAELASVDADGAGRVYGMEVEGDWAYVWGTWSETFSDKETNEQIEDSGSWLSILKRTPDGWKFYLDIWNRDA